MQTPESRLLVISYIALRRIVGILGFALPFVLALGALLVFNTGLQGTLSGYYHTNMRDIFVGAIWAIAFVLFSYKGYDRKDDIAGNLACIFAIGLTLFPTTPEAPPNELTPIGIIHVCFAALFFLTLIYFSWFLFTKTLPGEAIVGPKKARNFIYRACAIIMALCMILMVIYTVLPKGTQMTLLPIAPIFWLESIAILAFGVSWGIKGQIFFRDQTD